MSRFLLAALFLSLLVPVNAQKFLTSTDSAIDKSEYNLISDLQISYLNAFYDGSVDIADELINGREYVPYYLKCKIKPLLLEEKERTGSLTFKGRKYTNLKLEYDTFLDQLIYSDSTKLINDRLFKIALNKDPVDGFTLIFGADSMIFKHFRSDDGGKFNLADGFYEVVYDGNSKYIIRHQSFLVEKEGEYEYRVIPAEYALVGDRFSRVRSSGSFVKLFGKDSDAVRKYMRTNKVHYKSADKNEIAAVMRYYDSLVITKK
jgi:hypothetical protein